MTKQLTLLLVDDHHLVRKSLRVLLEQDADFSVIGEAGNGQEAIDQARRLNPDTIVMDINMPGLNGIEVTRRLRSEDPDCLILALSMHSGRQFVEEMLAAGASGYMLKENAPEELLHALKVIKAGKCYLCAEATDIVLSRIRQDSLQDDDAHSRLPSSQLQRTDLPAVYLRRPALIRNLNCGLDKKLILLSAPAGYGKSTLVSDWLGQCHQRSCWLSLEQGDNDLRRFLASLIAAIVTIIPEGCMSLQPLVEAANLPPISILAKRFCAALEKVNDPFTIVLDNLNLTRDKSIHDLLSRLLIVAHSSMTLVLIDRQDPFLPLAALRADNEICEIRTQSLRFTEEEIETFLGQSLGKNLGPETIALWSKRTEGRVAGLLHALETPETIENQRISDKKMSSWREALTNREYEILLLLRERLRDKEIAERLYVSSETVKSHLKNLYGKLDAKDRRDAIDKAEELGYLSRE